VLTVKGKDGRDGVVELETVQLRWGEDDRKLETVYVRRRERESDK
jgi:hypothetical protein